jgi:hypothetical protein
MTTTKFVKVTLDDKPGALGKATRALAEGNVNVEAFNCGGTGTVNFLTNNPNEALNALKNGGFKAETVEVFRVNLPNTPGELATVTEALGKQGINIESAFGATGSGSTGTIFLRVKDVKKATPILENVGQRTATARN